MQTLPHLHFRGNCREALDFYAATLGGRIPFAMSYGESPAAAETPPAMRQQIIHARLEFGGAAIAGCDVPPERYQRPQGFNVIAAVPQLNEASRIFATLAAGGSILMPFGPTFWAAGFGMCTDRFGIPWMVNCEKTA